MKLKILVFASALMLMINFSANAQSAINKMYATPGGQGGHATCIVQTADSGFMMGGIIYDSTFYTNSDASMIKTDKSGNIQWKKKLSHREIDNFNSVIKTTDGGFLFIGSTEDFNSGNSDVLAVRADASGNILWTKTIGGSGNDFAEKAIQTTGGGFLICGRTNSFGFGNYDALLIKLSPSGALNWSKSYGGSGYDAANDIIQSEQDFLICSATGSSGGNNNVTFLFKVNSGGTIIWTKYYSSGYGAQSVLQLADKSMVITGNSGGSLMLMKTDSSGNPAWAKQYSGSEFFRDLTLLTAADGGFFISGTRDGIPPYYAIFLLKTDANGNPVWTKEYGGFPVHSANSALLAFDGSLVIGGLAGLNNSGGSPSAAEYEPLLLKTDASFNSTCYSDSLAFQGQPLITSATSGGSAMPVSPALNSVFASLSDAEFEAWNYCNCTPPYIEIFAGTGTTVCNGGSVFLNAYSNSGNAFQWRKNGADIPGATSTVYVAASQGNYSCRTVNSCAGAVSNSIVVAVNPLPNANITASGPLSFCSGGSVTLNAPVAANRAYQWKRNGTNIAGATASFLIVSASGNYKVQVTNTNTGCSKTTGTATVVTVYSKPNALITPSGTITFCAGQSATLTANSGSGYTYKWKKDGSYIPGATSISYTVTTAGLYKVEVTRSNGCSKTSKADTVVVPCRGLSQNDVNVQENSQTSDLFVFPNPAAEKITIKTQLPSNAGCQLTIFDLSGRAIYHSRSGTLNGEYNLAIQSSGAVTLDVSALSQGVYIVEVNSGSQTLRGKFVKQ